MQNEFSYKITKHIATLSTNGTTATELNLISYNGFPEKLDLRKWDTENNKMLKGITLNADETRLLRDSLNDLEWLK